ncbi:MAG: hypothetical protein ABIO82_05725 [Ginsengibacter sp.]
MRYYFLLWLLLPAYSFAQNTKAKISISDLDKIAVDYVRLGLSIGQYDDNFVDAYYGPDSLKPVSEKQAIFPKDSFLHATKVLQVQLTPLINSEDASISKRANWLNGQLTAFGRRIKMFAGEQCSFEQQVKELFGVEPPVHNEVYFKRVLDQLNDALPGEGSVSARFHELESRFIIPKEKLDTVIKTTIAESKRRTLEHIQLPASENFELEYKTNKPWGGYNWYQGNFKSLMQFNTDVNWGVSGVIDLASHEGYPGHHVYNILLEKNLYNDKGWIEISIYPLFSPQSLIAEGSANYGIEAAYPTAEKWKFIKEQLLPLASLDTTGITRYFEALAVKGKLSDVRIEICRRLLNGKMTEAAARRWLIEYGLTEEKDVDRSLSFIKKYQSYIINYTFGLELVRNYIESNGGTESNPSRRWELFAWLLSNEVTPQYLLMNMKR